MTTDNQPPVRTFVQQVLDMVNSKDLRGFVGLATPGYRLLLSGIATGLMAKLQQVELKGLDAANQPDGSVHARVHVLANGKAFTLKAKLVPGPDSDITPWQIAGLGVEL